MTRGLFCQTVPLVLPKTRAISLKQAGAEHKEGNVDPALEEPEGEGDEESLLQADLEGGSQAYPEQPERPELEQVHLREENVGRGHGVQLGEEHGQAGRCLEDRLLPGDKEEPQSLAQQFVHEIGVEERGENLQIAAVGRDYAPHTQDDESRKKETEQIGQGRYQKCSQRTVLPLCPLDGVPILSLAPLGLEFRRIVLHEPEAVLLPEREYEGRK